MIKSYAKAAAAAIPIGLAGFFAVRSSFLSLSGA